MSGDPLGGDPLASWSGACRPAVRDEGDEPRRALAGQQAAPARTAPVSRRVERAYRLTIWGSALGILVFAGLVVAWALAIGNVQSLEDGVDWATKADVQNKAQTGPASSL